MNPMQRAWLRHGALALLALNATAADPTNPKSALGESLTFSVLAFVLPLLLWTQKQRELRSDTMLSERIVGLSCFASLSLFILFPDPLGAVAGGLLRLLTWPLVFLGNRPWGLAGMVLNFNLLAIANSAVNPDFVPGLWISGLLSLILVANEARLLRSQARSSARARGKALRGGSALPQHAIILLFCAVFAWLLEHSLPEITTFQWLRGRAEPGPPAAFGAFEILILLLSTGLVIVLLARLRRGKQDRESGETAQAAAEAMSETWPESLRLKIVRSYLDWLQRLSKRGLERHESETGRDFSARLADRGLSPEALSRSLGIFELARYASDAPDPESFAAIQRELARLDKALPAADAQSSDDLDCSASLENDR